jgi:hypothetical protein
MRGARLAKIMFLVLGGLTLFGSGCFGTTTTQGLAQTGVQTVIQTLISLFVQQIFLNVTTTTT